MRQFIQIFLHYLKEILPALAAKSGIEPRSRHGAFTYRARDKLWYNIGIKKRIWHKDTVYIPGFVDNIIAFIGPRISIYQIGPSAAPVEIFYRKFHTEISMKKRNLSILSRLQDQILLRKIWRGMMRKTVIGLVILSIALLGVFTLANKALRAETAGSDPEVLKKLDDISSSQKAILKALADLKQDLYIIKIRVTQTQ